MKTTIMILAALCLAIVLLLVGCAPKTGTGSGNDAGNENNGKPEDSETKNAVEDTGETNGSDIPLETLPKIWVINVNHTQTSKITMDGGDGPVTFDLTVTLKLWLTKGGDNPMGSYTGTAVIKYEYSMDKGQYGGTATGGGMDKAAKVELMDYDRETFDREELLDDVVPLVKADDMLTTLVNYETMALGILQLGGGGDVEEWTENGGQWSDSQSGEIKTGIRIGIKNGIASVYLPQISGYTIYMGTLSYQAQ